MKKRFACALAVMLCMSYVSVYADGIGVKINEESVEFTDAQPIIVDSRTMVPLRGVFEELGYSIYWKANTKTAVIALKDKDTIRVTAGSSVFYKGETAYYAEVPAQIINGRMYLPLRAIGEAAGLKIAWDESTKTVYIGDGATKVKEAAMLSAKELKELATEGYTAKFCEEVADKYTDYISEGHTSSEYVEQVTEFLNNETIGLTEDYKYKFLAILSLENEADMQTTLQSFAEEMSSKVDELRVRMDEIENAADGAVVSGIERIIAAKAFGEYGEYGEKLESAQSAGEYAAVYRDMFKEIEKDVKGIKVQSEEEEQVMDMYKAAFEVVIGLADYVANSDFEMNFVEIVM